MKAVNFIPKVGEIIVYDPDKDHAAARVKIGDGVKTVEELAFIDDAAKAALFKEIDMVDEKVEALEQLVGDEKISEQISAAVDELSIVSKTGSWNDLLDKPEEIAIEDIDRICGMTIIASDEDYIDETTGTMYRLYVDNGNLHMTEVD